ncbi:hypothetical protein Q7A53_02100 [Halobacillus rhizosphaerae]|uniref:hypothetical protein n=1 Tax=Halobacillus rhizosphaerae TaxID=3064889 RepID=UPI00398A5913
MTIHKAPIDYITIPAPQHSEDAEYRVVFGYVDWQNGKKPNLSIYVLMVYGGKPNYRMVAHVLTTSNNENELSDLDKVMSAMQKLKDRHIHEISKYKLDED